MKILIIQKSVVLCQRLITLVEASHGYEAIGFVGAPGSALNFIASDKPDALLLDLHLAGGGAFSLLEALRSSGRMLPVVILAEIRSEEYRSRATELGASAILSKDEEFEAIVPTLDRILQAGSRTETVALS